MFLRVPPINDGCLKLSVLRLRRVHLPRFHLQQVHLPQSHLQQVHLPRVRLRQVHLHWQLVKHPCQSERAPHTKPFSSLSHTRKRQKSPTTLSSPAQALEVVLLQETFSSPTLGLENAKSVLVIEIGDLPFHSHCLNSSRPTGFDDDRGQQNDTFSLFREKYKFSPDTDVSDWNGSRMYNLGDCSAAWGLFSPRMHDEILAHQFAPRTELHDEQGSRRLDGFIIA